jgi:hypothetical protein
MRPCLTAGLVEVSLLLFSRKSTSASGRTAFHDRSSFPTRIGLAATEASPALCLLQIRVDNDTPSFAAITCVAPGVRFSNLAIFVTPALALAIVFICRTSSLVHSRRTIFLVLAIVTPVLWTGLVSRDPELATVKDMKHARVRACVYRAASGALRASQRRSSFRAKS